MYPEKRVTELIAKEFNPVRLHVKTHPEAMGRFGANWTPTVMILDSNGTERYRIEGYLPADDFLAQVNMGLAQTAFKTNKFDEAEKRFRAILDQFPKSEVAAEAQYWAGVSRYKGTNDASALGATAKAFTERYQDSPWAKKASIWA